MNTTPDNQFEHNQFEANLRGAFRRSCADIDPPSLHILARARREALDPAPRRRGGHMLIPAGAVAASLLAFVLVSQWPGSTQMPPQSQAQQLAASTVPEDADVEFFSDIEFYRWLAAQSPKTAQR